MLVGCSLKGSASALEATAEHTFRRQERRAHFRVPHRGHVTPLPRRWTSRIATPMVSTKPKVMDMKPSNVRHVMT